MYNDGEALLAALLQTVAGFSASNVKRADWSVLNSGLSARYIILRPGAFTRSEQGSGLVFENKWTTVIEVWQQYVDDGTTGTALQADAMAVMNKIDQYRKLGDTTGKVRDATVRRGDGIEQVLGKAGDGPFWLRWSLHLTWEEEENVTPAE